jgi:hypothetical protein
MYVIQRDDGSFVTPPGSPHSYTRDLAKAWTFAAKEDARPELCPENEHVVEVSDVMSAPQK